MPNKDQNISQTIKGMIWDMAPFYLKDGMYAYAKNVVVEGFDGSGMPILQNEPSNILAVTFPSGSTVVGYINIVEQNRIIWFLSYPYTGMSEIGETLNASNCRKYVQDGNTYCDACSSPNLSENTPLETINQKSCATYTTIQQDACLNFSNKYPINSIVYRILQCTLQIFFTDDYNNRRWLEFNYVNDDPTQSLVILPQFYQIIGYQPAPCNDPIYGNDLNCDALEIQPLIDTPCIEVTQVVNGGSLIAGDYQFLLAFADAEGNTRTNWFSPTNPVSIFVQSIISQTAYPTNKAISLAINNLDPQNNVFQFYNLAVAQTIDNVVSFALIGTFPVTQDTYTYTGDNKSQISLTANDIFQVYPYYATAKTVCKSNGFLFWGNLTESIKPNLQQVANNIILYWQTIAIPEYLYNDPIVFNKYRGFMRDEVYPFGIIFIYDSGEESNAYHIPGREAMDSDLTVVNNNDSIQENNCVDCSGTTGSVDEQQIITDINDFICTGNTGCNPTLNPNNANQSDSCPLTPYSASGCSSGITLNPPVVNAGPNQTFNNYVSFVSLSGTATPTVATNVITSTTWYQLSGPNQVSISNPTNLSTSWSGMNTGTYVFQLCVQDSAGNIITATVTYTVNIGTLTAPIADPGGDQVTTLPAAAVYLNGSNSSDQSGIGSVLWTQLSGPNSATITGGTTLYAQASGLIEGTYQFQLEVTNIRGCSSYATTLVYVCTDPCSSIPTCTPLLYPLNGSQTSSFNVVTLQWTAENCSTSYDVYLEQGSSGYTMIGNTTNNYLVVSNLIPNTIYNWYVVPLNNVGSATGCTECYYSFVTPVAPPSQLCTRQRWQVYNTATIIGGDLNIYNGCDETCYQYGLMSYWESTETYPNNPPDYNIWGNLCGEPIRHHKFPDSLITHIHDGINATPNYNGSNIIYVMGVKVDQDSVTTAINNAVSNGFITQDDANRIVGYRIVRGNRFDNKSVVAKGLLFDVNNYQRTNNGQLFDQEPIYFSNYPFNDLNSNPFITNTFDNYSVHNQPEGPDLPFDPSNRYTFHSPDTHFNEPIPGSILKLETVEYGQSQGYYSYSLNQAKQRFLSDTSYALAFISGVIAYLLTTTKKTDKQYTVKGSVTSAMGVAAGELGPFLPYQAGLGAGILYETDVVDLPLNPSQSFSINDATEVTSRTVQGTYSDFINPLYLLTNKPELLIIYPFILANFIEQFLTTTLQEANIVLNLIKALTPFRQWCIQYQGIGNYNSYSPVFNDTGNKIRAIDSYAYLNSDNTTINEPSQLDPTENLAIFYNNYNRESSLYLRYAGIGFPDAGTASGIEDTSRQLCSQSPFNCILNSKQYTDISSYYASLKNYVPDQYGSIYNINYLPTGSCYFTIGQSDDICQGVYGGDTFIGKFALKIKVPYFLATTFNLPEGTDFAYDLYPNLAIPRFYYDNEGGIGTNTQNVVQDFLAVFSVSGIATIMGRPKSIRDCSTDTFFYQNGYIYLYHYGIPYFFVESDYNTYYRYGTNNNEGDFFPNQQDLNYWLQEINVPIDEDNTYYYNNTYSKQNKETSIGIDGPLFQPGRSCRVSYPNRIIYSNQNDWLLYSANNFYDYPIDKGEIVGMSGIENDTVIVRTINSTSIFKSILRQTVDGQTVQVGNGSIFENPPQDFGETTLGYVGSQHSAILNTEFGHVWVDAKRGQIFNMQAGGGGLDEISNRGMKNWFKENLPFRLLRDFSNMTYDDIDNNLLGMGITMSFDKRFNRILITKLDWHCFNPDVLWDNVNRNFYITNASGTTIVTLGDRRYFYDCSWTASYNFYLQGWVCFHSYTPNYYIDFIDFYSSGINTSASGGTSTYWVHDLYNGSFQVFYGKLCPMVIEPIINFQTELKQLNSIEFDTEVRRYSNEFDYTIKKKIPGFNKAIIYNDWYNTGLLELNYIDKSKDLSLMNKFPIKEYNKWKIEIAISNFKWRFNQFFSLNRDASEIPLWIYDGNNEDKQLNEKAFSYKKNDFTLARLKGQWFKERFINDKYSNYKIIFKFTNNNQTVQFR